MERFGYGLPLWDPSPAIMQSSESLADISLYLDDLPSMSRAIDIKVGSVLYPGDSGRFDVLLNTMKPENDPIWQPNGVPTGFQTLQAYASKRSGRPVLSGPNPIGDLCGLRYHNLEVDRDATLVGDLDV